MQAGADAPLHWIVLTSVSKSKPNLRSDKATEFTVGVGGTSTR